MNNIILLLCILINPIFSGIHELEFNKVYRKSILPIENDLKVTVVVPCHPAHAKHLYSLLRNLEDQSVLPDEVIISLSEYVDTPTNILKQLQQCLWAFPVTMVFSERKLNPGQNRNVGSSIANGDVFIYLDADDQPHRQRIEIIKLLFKSYNLDLLMHRFIELHQPSDIALGEYEYVEFLRPSDYDSQILGKDIHNGNTAISKRLFSTFKWPDYRVGEDETFNRILYKHFDNKMIVLTPLIIYRHYLSSEYQHNLASIHRTVESEPEKNLNKTHKMAFRYNTL